MRERETISVTVVSDDVRGRKSERKLKKIEDPYHDRRSGEQACAHQQSTFRAQYIIYYICCANI